MLRLTGRGVPRSTTVTSTSSPGIRDSPGEGERREGWGGEGGVVRGERRKETLGMSIRSSE